MGITSSRFRQDAEFLLRAQCAGQALARPEVLGRSLPDSQSRLVDFLAKQAHRIVSIKSSFNILVRLSQHGHMVALQCAVELSRRALTNPKTAVLREMRKKLKKVFGDDVGAENVAAHLLTFIAVPRATLLFGSSIVPRVDNAMPFLVAAEYGHWEVVKWMVSEGVDALARDERTGFGLLHAVCKGGQTELLDHLLSWDLEIVTENGLLPLHSSWHRAPDSNATSEWVDMFAKGGVTPLMVAAFFGRQACVELLLQRGASLRYLLRGGAAIPLPSGSSALHCAARGGSCAVAIALLKGLYNSAGGVLPQDEDSVGTRAPWEGNPRYDLRARDNNIGLMPFKYASMMEGVTTALQQLLHPSLPLALVIRQEDPEWTGHENGVPRLYAIALATLRDHLLSQLDAIVAGATEPRRRPSNVSCHSAADTVSVCKRSSFEAADISLLSTPRQEGSQRLHQTPRTGEPASAVPSPSPSPVPAIVPTPPTTPPPPAVGLPPLGTHLSGWSINEAFASNFHSEAWSGVGHIRRATICGVSVASRADGCPDPPLQRLVSGGACSDEPGQGADGGVSTSDGAVDMVPSSGDASSPFICKQTPPGGSADGACSASTTAAGDPWGNSVSASRWPGPVLPRPVPRMRAHSLPIFNGLPDIVADSDDAPCPPEILTAPDTDGGSPQSCSGDDGACHGATLYANWMHMSGQPLDFARNCTECRTESGLDSDEEEEGYSGSTASAAAPLLRRMISAVDISSCMSGGGVPGIRGGSRSLTLRHTQDGSLRGYGNPADGHFGGGFRPMHVGVMSSPGGLGVGVAGLARSSAMAAVAAAGQGNGSWHGSCRSRSRSPFGNLMPSMAGTRLPLRLTRSLRSIGSVRRSTKGSECASAAEVAASVASDESDILCPICMDSEAIVSVEACSHCLCAECARRLCVVAVKPAQCPMCRVTVNRFVRAEHVA